MKTIFLALVLATFTACGGGAGHATQADGPLPKGQHRKRGLVLVEEQKKPKVEPKKASSGDGTSTPEIVESVAQDQP